MGWWKNSTIFPPGGSGRENGQYPGAAPGDIPVWYPRFEYDLGIEVLAPDGNYYRTIQNHIASDSFASDIANWVMFAGPGINVAHNLATVLAVGNITGPNDINVSLNQRIYGSGGQIFFGQTGSPNRLRIDAAFGDLTIFGLGIDMTSEGPINIGTDDTGDITIDATDGNIIMSSSEDVTITASSDLILSGVTVKMLQVPPTDNTNTMILTRDSVSGNIELRDVSTISSPTPNLSSVLGIGNTTGANDIVISSGQKISSSNGTATLELDASSTANSIFMTTGAGAAIKSDFYLDDGYIELTFDNGNSGVSITDGGAGTSRVKIHGTDRIELRSDDLRLIPGGGGNYSELDLSLISGSNKILTVPNATGTIALTSDFQTSQVYTPSNVTTDRSFDANATTIDEIADVLGTLISDLQSVDIIS